MSKLARLAGYVWAAPVTVFGLVYVFLFSLLGWYRRVGTFDCALVWELLPDKAPRWFNNAWKHWAGHTVGNVVVMKVDPRSDRGKIILKHEQKHVNQCMRLGVFQPIVYVLCYLAIKIGCPGSDPYYTCVFEVDARRYAGQVIDVEGSVKRLQAYIQKKHT